MGRPRSKLMMEFYKLNTLILLISLLGSGSMAGSTQMNQPTTSATTNNGNDNNMDNDETISPTIITEVSTRDDYATTRGPRLRDAIRYKFHRGFAALKGEEKKVESGAKEGFGSAKMKMMANGAKYLVDYEVGLRTYAYIIKNSNEKNWGPKDIEIIQQAIKAALKPLKTYQQAEEKVHKRKLGQSVKELFRLLSNKPIKYALQEGDWEKGKIHSSVFRRFDIQDLFAYRDRVLLMRPEVTEDLLNLENHKLSNARKYFMKKEDDSWKFRKYICADLDWSGFESRYLEVVTKLLVADPTMVKEARHYLAIYLFTGDSQEYHYRSMMDEALKNRDRQINQPTQTLGTPLGASSTTMAATVTVTVDRPAFRSRFQYGSSNAIKVQLYSLLLPVILLLTIVL